MLIKKLFTSVEGESEMDERRNKYVQGLLQCNSSLRRIPLGASRFMSNRRRSGKRKIKNQ
jgi:hypothetical protein